MFLPRLCAPQSVLSRCARTGCPVSPFHAQTASLFHTQVAQLNSNRTSIVRCERQKYERLYPVMLVRPDGSTVNIRYTEPRRILVLPVDLSDLSDKERRARLKKRDVRKVEKKKEVHYENDFKLDTYSHLWEKK